MGSPRRTGHPSGQQQPGAASALTQAQQTWQPQPHQPWRQQQQQQQQQRQQQSEPLPQSPPPPPQQQQQQSRRQGRARGRGAMQQPRPQPHPGPGPPDTNPTSRSQEPSPAQDPASERDAAQRSVGSPATATTASTAVSAAAAATLWAALHCPAAPTAEEGPGALEVLLRSHGRYLSLRARWQRGAAAAAPASDTYVDPNAEEDDGTASGGGGPVVPRALPDALVAADVNRLHLLQLELMELPGRPGIALVDFRWRDRPCRAVPLVLTSHPAVAAELQAAAAGWSRPQAELDELLLDYGTWEFHVSSAVQLPRPSAAEPAAASSLAAGSVHGGTAAAMSAGGSSSSSSVGGDGGGGGSSGGGGGGGGGPMQPLSVTRLLDLSAHLLRYVDACGWVGTAAHIRSRLAGLCAAGAAPSNGTPAADPAAAAAARGAPSTLGADSAGRSPSGGDPPSAAAAGAVAASSAAAAAAPAAVSVATAPAKAQPGPAASDDEGKQARRMGSEPAQGAPTSAPVGGGAAAAAGRRAAAEAGPRPGVPWASAVVLPALGFDRATPAEAAAFAEYADPWVRNLSPVLLLTDMSSLVVLLLRGRAQLLTPSSASIWAACVVSLLVVLAWLVLPYTTRMRLLRLSRYARLAGYCAAKGLVALGGFPLPAGVLSYARGGTLLLMEGIVVPAASMLPPAAAAVLFSCLAAMTSKMLLVVGAVTRGSDAALHGLCAAVLGFATTAACHAYLRYHFWWHCNRLQRHEHGHGRGRPTPLRLHSKKEE
ncbi:hypothetical protein PLESTB_001019400 [Pleodorina starrii]|uniref:Uncharacterized protein n=1 Tax=Pleodorina starrii TaxID=330485 RepID=A0A9W6BPH3_9CHLO|nr:hypothetical protein PLESTB_001019400 [Pleodorina starrii]GLC65475.1 hypothetical protein PLESTF_000297500 [Pleodorina starrii]